VAPSPGKIARQAASDRLAARFRDRRSGQRPGVHGTPSVHTKVAPRRPTEELGRCCEERAARAPPRRTDRRTGLALPASATTLPLATPDSRLG
jgi:hypothetical protein